LGVRGCSDEEGYYQKGAGGSLKELLELHWGCEEFQLLFFLCPSLMLWRFKFGSSLSNSCNEI